ncbi:MAG: glutathione synthase [Gammaproteobacteria bacterium]|nr:glutathione synthase [Gammaproteobacteria bacterium]
MTLKLGVVMDPIETIHYAKDSTLAMLVEAQRRGYELFYMRQTDLFMRDTTPMASMRRLRVKLDPAQWFEWGDPQRQPLAELQVILLRTDPPVDMNYLYTTHLLELAQSRGCLVVNRPQSLRDANEKLFILQFPECIPPTLVSSQPELLREFLSAQHDIILKPLDAMGGRSIFRLTRTDPNLNVVLETMTQLATRPIMAQRYLPEVRAGDKRILLIDGEPIPYALARIPAVGETRANLAAGGQGKGVELSARDRWICAQVSPQLKTKGLLFVGLDVIGDYLTEINVTSPTCIRELDHGYGLNISGTLMDAIESRLRKP